MSRTKNEMLEIVASPWPLVYQLSTLNVMTLTLGSQSKQGHGKVLADNVTLESHSHSWECQKV